MIWSLVLLWMLVKTGLVLLLFLAKPGSQILGWNVTYTPSKICAVQHSSVVLSCKCSYPKDQKISTYAWYYKKKEGAEAVVIPVNLFPLESKKKTSAGLDCSITLRNVTHDSAGIYQFSLRNNISSKDLTNRHGVTLEITDLKVEIESESDVITVGQWLMLICGTCIPSLTLPTYIWHKDGHLHSEILGNNHLDLQDVVLEDGGSYSCSMSGHEGLQSSAVNVIVKSPPKNVLVSIRLSGGIVEGSSVTLTCSSDAYPPVENYTWFKDGGRSPVGSGHSYSFIVNYTTSGRYYCEVQNGHGSLRSAFMPVLLKAGHSLIMYIGPGVGFCIIVALVGLVLCLRSKKQNRQAGKDGIQNANPHVEDNTYTALDLSAKSNDDVYQTLAMVHPSSPIDFTRDEASDYENVPTSKKVTEPSDPLPHFQ